MLTDAAQFVVWRWGERTVTALSLDRKEEFRFFIEFYSADSVSPPLWLTGLRHLHSLVVVFVYLYAWYPVNLTCPGLQCCPQQHHWQTPTQTVVGGTGISLNMLLEPMKNQYFISHKSNVQCNVLLTYISLPYYCLCDGYHGHYWFLNSHFYKRIIIENIYFICFRREGKTYR